LKLFTLPCIIYLRKKYVNENKKIKRKLMIIILAFTITLFSLYLNTGTIAPLVEEDLIEFSFRRVLL